MTTKRQCALISVHSNPFKLVAYFVNCSVLIVAFDNNFLLACHEPAIQPVVTVFTSKCIVSKNIHADAFMTDRVDECSSCPKMEWLMNN